MKKPIETHSSNSFSRGVGTASESVHHAIDQAAKAANPIITGVTKGAHKTVDKMADGANHAADALVHKGEQLSDLQHRLSEGTRKQVQKHPLLTISIALAGGALLGYWLTHKSDTK